MALERLSLPPAETAYVGDSPEDVAMAKAAGAFAVGVPGGFPNREALAASRPDDFDDKPWFAHLNTSKRSLAIDRKRPESREIITPFPVCAHTTNVRDDDATSDVTPAPINERLTFCHVVP